MQGFADPDRFTTAMYQAHVAGKPRLGGARAALEALGVPDAERQAAAYAERKQKRLEELIDAGGCHGLSRRASLRPGGRGARLADGGRIVLEERQPDDEGRSASTPAQACSTSSTPMSAAAICGRASRTRRFSCWPPRSFGSSPHSCFVAEDAPAGIEAARAGGMTGARRRPTGRRGLSCGRQEPIWW